MFVVYPVGSDGRIKEPLGNGPYAGTIEGESEIK